MAQRYSSILLQRVEITENFAQLGGGMMLEGDILVAERLRVVNNVAWHDGGGLAIQTTGDWMYHPQFSDTTFEYANPTRVDDRCRSPRAGCCDCCFFYCEQVQHGTIRPWRWHLHYESRCLLELTQAQPLKGQRRRMARDHCSSVQGLVRSDGLHVHQRHDSTQRRVERRWRVLQALVATDTIRTEGDARAQSSIGDRRRCVHFVRRLEFESVGIRDVDVWRSVLQQLGPHRRRSRRLGDFVPEPSQVLAHLVRQLLTQRQR